MIVPGTSAISDLITRPRSSRRWSIKGIRPSGSTPPDRRRRRRTAKPVTARHPSSRQPGSGRPRDRSAVVEGALRRGGGRGRRRSGLAVGDLPRCGAGGRRRAGRGGGGWVVVVAQALGLGLEDPQRSAQAARRVGQALGAEEQDEENQEDQ